MGNTESHSVPCSIEKTDDTKKPSTRQCYFDKYNWVPSLPGFEYPTLNMVALKRKFNLDSELAGYVDLRTSFPQIRSIDSLPFNPIISVTYLLHYQLLKNKLPIFPPSAMYIYKNMEYYRDIKSLFSFDGIFKSIQNYGFCSENDISTTASNLNRTIDQKLLEKSCAFKFIEVYKVEQELEVIKTLLSNEFPILVGFTVFYDLGTIDAYMWIPDKELDKKIGGLTVVLVGYIEERQMFIAATTFGKYCGTNGFIMIPYEYILNKDYTGELFTLDFKKERVEGYINQRKEMVNLQQDAVIQQDNKKQYQQDSFGGLFR
jgi:hypothetical protein